MAVKNKALAGGAVGLVLVGAYYLSGLFNGFGLGPGGGGGTGTGTGNDNATKTANSTEEPDKDNTNPVSLPEPGGAELGKIVYVLIDGEQYKVLKAPDAEILVPSNYRPARLEEIVQLAKEAEGVQGLKVYIAMRATSTAQAEATLQTALVQSGLPRTAFRDWPQTIP